MGELAYLPTYMNGCEKLNSVHCSQVQFSMRLNINNFLYLHIVLIVNFLSNQIRGWCSQKTNKKNDLIFVKPVFLMFDYVETCWIFSCNILNLSTINCLLVYLVPLMSNGIPRVGEGYPQQNRQGSWSLGLRERPQNIFCMEFNNP